MLQWNPKQLLYGSRFKFLMESSECDFKSDVYHNQSCLISIRWVISATPSLKWHATKQCHHDKEEKIAILEISSGMYHIEVGNHITYPAYCGYKKIEDIVQQSAAN